MPIDIEKDDLKTALQKLKAREDNFKQLESISKMGSWEVDLVTKKSIWSDESYKIYGLEKGSIVPTLDTFLSKLVDEDIPRAKKVLQQAMVTGKVTTFEATAKRTNGELINILINGKIIYNEHKQPIKIIGTTQNITEYVELKRDVQEFYDIIDKSTSEIYIIDSINYKYVYANKGALKSLGYTKDELFELGIFEINPSLSFQRAKNLADIMDKNGYVLNRTTHKRKDGTYYHVQAYIQPITYKGKASYILFDTDITQLVELEEKQKETERLLRNQTKELNYQATHDSLTKLPNRALFEDRLKQTIASSKRNNKKFAVLFIDLDQFKRINDSYGHHVGDKVLIEASSRLSSIIREEDTLSRLGGDEFTVILQNINTNEDIKIVADKIINAMKEPVHENLYISASIGIASYPNDTQHLQDLIKFADTAMYKAKEFGRNRYEFYSSELSQKAFEDIVIQNNLHIALKEEQFVVYFQPQYNTITKKLIGLEALVRWNHPKLGLIPPNKFIPIAEESDIIIEIDKFVMKKSMQQFCEWYKNGLNPGKLALNLTMKQLNKDDFVDFVLSTMNDLDFKSSWLELEVTEGQVMNNPLASIQKLNSLNNLGIEIAIDDFGTGYSSLAYLKKLPLDKLKIDRSFIKDIPTDEDDKAISKAIIALAQSLNLKLIAEGVEIEEQEKFLQENGCNFIQGFLYAKPMPATDITEILTTN